MKRNLLIIFVVFVGFLIADYYRYDKFLFVDNLIQISVFAVLMLGISLVFRRKKK